MVPVLPDCTLRLNAVCLTWDTLDMRAAVLIKGWAEENECDYIRIKLAVADFVREYCITEDV